LLAIVSEKPRTSSDELLRMIDELNEPALLLLLEGVDDARNLGFTLRTADALGAHAVLIKKHLWDFDATEVARPASGAYERLPLVQLDDVTTLTALQRHGLKLYGCIAGARRTMRQVDFAGPSILAIGGEKRGLSGAVRDICDRFITIPTRGGASLSMSHAAAILLGEAHRQRTPASDDSVDAAT
jgi:23S rRNA (guanosine2251-2'-O)-methyltransferase